MDDDRSEVGRKSVIDSLGIEIVGVMCPVSICMLLVVLLVSALAPPPPSSSAAASPAPPVTAATLVYIETPSDPPSRKLLGSLLNAAAFVAFVAAATFLIVILYYYNFTGFLKNYMRFSVFFVIASMGGSISLSLLRAAGIPLDAVTAFVLIFNLSVVGVLSVFSPALPILLRQAYTVFLGVIVAVWFSKLPEWTTWTLLLALSVYDLVAVLAPHGPLKLLVELASTRDEELPALVYEARPTVSRAAVPDSPSAILPVLSGTVELQPLSSSSTDPGGEIQLSQIAESSNTAHDSIEEENSDNVDESLPLISGEVGDESPDPARGERAVERESSSRDEMLEMTRGIRLGLGDFVFYGVLVGRAAMYGLMTVYSCYLAIISGLGCTLILLSLCRQALPALPISITLGVVFYFLTWLLMEPFVVGASTRLVMF